MRFALATTCASSLFTPPLHAQEQRLCDALGLSCVVLEQYAPSERYQPLAYTYQTRTAGTEARAAPFDPTHGLWLSTFRPDFAREVTPPSPGPFLMNITGGSDYNFMEVFRLHTDPIRSEKIWEGYIQPQIATIEPSGGMEQHLTFALVASRASNLPIVGQTATTEFAFLQPWHDGAWWNELQLSPAAGEGTAVGLLLERRLTEQSVTYSWAENGLVLTGRLDTGQVRNALFQNVSRGADFNMQYAGAAALTFNRIHPQHPVGSIAQENVLMDMSNISDAVLGRAGSLLTQLVAAEEQMLDDFTLGSNETSILDQWLPVIGPAQYREVCRPEADWDRLQLYDRRIYEVWQRIERVSDILQPGWQTLLDDQTLEQFESLHSTFSLEAAQILLTDPCVLMQTDRMPERLERAETAAISIAETIEGIQHRQDSAAVAIADAAAAAREQIPSHAMASERAAFAAWRALSEAYAGMEPRRTAVNGSIGIVSYFLKDRSYHFSRAEDYENCTLSISPTSDLDALVSFKDEGCNGAFARYDSAGTETEIAEQQAISDIILPWLAPRNTTDVISFIQPSNNAIVDLLVNAVNIDAWFYGIREVAQGGRAVMEEEFIYRQVPYEYSTTTITTNSFGDERIGPTRTYRYTADDFSFTVANRGRTAVYTVSRDQEDRFMSLTAAFDPPIAAPSSLQFLNGLDHIDTIEIFARTDEFFAPLADQSVKLNGVVIADGQMILVAGFLQDIFETMAHHMVMGQNLAAFSVQTR